MFTFVCIGKVHRRGPYIRGKGRPLEVLGVGGGSLCAHVIDAVELFQMRPKQ